MLFIENLNLKKLVCAIFTLFLSSRNKPSQKYPHTTILVMMIIGQSVVELSYNALE